MELSKAVEVVKAACVAGSLLFMTYDPGTQSWDVVTSDELREAILEK